MNEQSRPDPLQLALTAIGDFDREYVAIEENLIEPGLDAKYERAQLRVWFALADEVRKARQELATQTGLLLSLHVMRTQEHMRYMAETEQSEDGAA